ncbi:MAG: tRNA 2-thiouridine(34) synthase MnmA [Thermodesulfobacteriota bacterium]
MMERVAIALSGGIDSMTAAYLLKKDGHDIFGIHFLTGFEKPNPINPEVDVPQAGETIQPIAQQLKIPLHVLDLSADFKKTIVDYFIEAYQSGQTPNPCLMCNPVIKFGILLDFARKHGANRLATGHYARIQKDENGAPRLFQGVDPEKDQSYFLARLNSEQLSAASFPLGELTKNQVRKLAGEAGLTPVFSRESQDVCFIKNSTYSEFLTSMKGDSPEEGWIEHIDGNRLGRHHGLHQFTIGQRKGINCPSSKPFYVVKLDTKRNRLIVGSKEDLLSGSCRVEKINWIGLPPETPLRVRTRIRFRHTAAPSMVIPIDEKTALVKFDEKQSAVTPGQGAVFYRRTEVLGGGWISSDSMPG